MQFYSFFNLGARCRWVVKSTLLPPYLQKELYRKLPKSEGRSIRVRKIPPQLGFEPQAVQRAVSCSKPQANCKYILKHGLPTTCIAAEHGVCEQQ
jgi:hypothetical protein